MPLRQVQAPQAPRRDLREVRRRGDAAKVRRERMGHIEFASPVAHIWFLKSLPSAWVSFGYDPPGHRAGALFRAYVVTDPGLTPLKRTQLLTEDDYLAKVEEFGDDFSAAMGAEGIRALLRSLDLNKAIDELRKDLGAPRRMPRSRRSPSGSRCSRASKPRTSSPTG